MAFPKCIASNGPMGYFAQVVMWVVSDKKQKQNKTKNVRLGQLMIVKVFFHHNNQHDNLNKISQWKQCIVGRPQNLL